MRHSPPCAGARTRANYPELGGAVINVAPTHSVESSAITAALGSLALFVHALLRTDALGVDFSGAVIDALTRFIATIDA